MTFRTVLGECTGASPTPATAGGTDQTNYPSFQHTATTIDIRIRHLLPVLTAAST